MSSFPQKLRSRLTFLFGFLLILFFPSQLGVHFWPDFAQHNGLKIDYLSPTLLFTDLLGIIFVFLSKPIFSKKFFILPIINLLVSVSFPISFFHWLRLIFYYLIYLSFKKNNKYQKYWIPALSLSVVWSSVLAILQFITGTSLGGLWYWLGERPLSLAVPYIAKVYLPDIGYFLRPYATFPHPNALFGYLLVSCLILYFYKKNWSIILGMLAALLTFSKLIFFPLIIFYPQSISERLSLIYNSFFIIQKYWFTGIGLGTYPAVSYSPATYQPVHNIFLLLLAELGLPMFIYFMFLIIKIYLKIKNLKLKIVLFSLLITGLLDHYWLTSSSNLLLLSLCLTLLPSSKTLLPRSSPKSSPLLLV